ncbi:hemerythrin domain-containing protein [Roseivirga misakiensis]|uniref:Iron-sulfur cluster repair di-iron protein n=1 Tax=Roseivirga misakiensis TaxID=1563681 RepID=A0A1E5T4Q1_9BACT|nr:hemerythrin domain-containing protein [Roseivirga misakiensis]OEK06267.1 iron-sulfur cluster repair di-iron protein [Roseivirga misakiensis]
MDHLLKTTITDLVSENHVRASVLYYFGVKFYDYKLETLEEVCSKLGLDALSVIKSLELVLDEKETTQNQLKAYPPELVTEYLKHAHYVFIKKRLPYIGQLIDGVKDVNFRYKSLSSDLKSIFPMFVEDFIHHIYEEEDTMFTYVERLSKFLVDEKPSSEIYYLMEKFSVQEFALEHEVHESEMEGFRKFTNNYQYCDEADLHIKVLFTELERFEKDLMIHAKIENEILFPKALQLERLAKLKFYDFSKLN